MIDRFLDRQALDVSSVEIEVVVRLIERCEERESQRVVPVHVGDEYRKPVGRFRAGYVQRSRPAVDEQLMVAVDLHRVARGGASVFAEPISEHGH
jgi:hypothetical protein